MRRGVGTSADGTTRVEYEISEYNELSDPDMTGTRGKRKIGDVGRDGEDAEMQ